VHRKSTIHKRILAALGALGAEDEARMAFHAEGAGDGGAVLRYATAAARRAASLASHQAGQAGRAHPHRCRVAGQAARPGQPGPNLGTAAQKTG
jgi:hypothetical protein